MARYYFDVSDGRCSADRDGVELPNEQAARREAVHRAIMLLRCSVSSTGDKRDWRLFVRNQAGTVVFNISSYDGVADYLYNSFH